MKKFTCPHCGKGIADKEVYAYTCGKAGRVKSKAKTEAARKNIKKRWDDVRKEKERQAEELE